MDAIPKDSKGKVFIDRDGVLFRYILDYLRNQNIVLPENFHEKARLRAEAEFFGLEGLLRSLESKEMFLSCSSHSPVILKHLPASLRLEKTA